ncbi:ATP-binding protein [Saccharothrix syringae]|uniref:Tetratricopeptide repeat protein n=1 Tax=Saccharothrix syringae TaxID=103733 RepID=A0A5Q0GY14_SACSY|nr:tetratricopeptide repeat protein [Saccharothrix syringae]QFZ18818.1 tetratricopeptide repeat protein [Saccharothrix syringae]
MGDALPGNGVVGGVFGAVVQAHSIAGDVRVHQPPPPVIAPHQLPPARTGFAGRVTHLAALDSVPAQGHAVGISVIDGMAGVGKSSLVVQWAHRSAERFPDGQLYVDLRGFDAVGVPVQPGEAIRGFLDALGVPGAVWPVDLDRQVALYRSLMAGRRVLIVLDNARDSRQVEPLLPGSPSCRVVVTSRYRLDNLVARYGAHTVTLTVLTEDESRELLTATVGAGRIAADRGAVDELVRLCDHLPLALSLVAARLVGEPHLSPSALAAELRDRRDRLDALDSGEPGLAVKAVFSWSYDALSAPAAALFRLIGLHPGPDLSPVALASLLGVDVDRARDLTRELTRAHLVEPNRLGRYRVHDLLRIYARERCDAQEPAEVREAAAHRLFDHYLHTATTADGHIGPPWEPLPATPPRAGVTVPDIGTRQQALAWFTDEHAVLVAVVAQSAAAGADRHTCRLARAMATYLDRRGHWQDFADTAHRALDAALRWGDPPSLAMAHRLLARALIRRKRLAPAREHLAHALRLFDQLDDDHGRAHTRYALGYLGVLVRDRAQALDDTHAALALAARGGYRNWQAKALNNIGWCHLEFDEHHEALPHCLEALRLFEALGTDPDGHAHVLECLGRAHAGTGRPELALEHYRRALALCEQRGNHFTQVTTLRHMAAAYQALGRGTEARATLHRALTMLRHLDSQDVAAVRDQLAALPPDPARPATG